MDFAEDGDGVDGGAVPAAVAELLLTLVYGDDGTRLDGFHHLDVASTDVFLLAHQTDQVVTLILRTDVRHRSRRRYRPDTIAVQLFVTGHEHSSSTRAMCTELRASELIYGARVRRYKSFLSFFYLCHIFTL